MFVNTPAGGNDPERPPLRRRRYARCPVCCTGVELLTFDAAAECFNTDLQDIEFLAAHGQIHRVHNRFGAVMICSDSLYKCFEQRRTRLLVSNIN